MDNIKDIKKSIVDKFNKMLSAMDKTKETSPFQLISLFFKSINDVDKIDMSLYISFEKEIIGELTNIITKDKEFESDVKIHILKFVCSCFNRNIYIKSFYDMRDDLLFQFSKCSDISSDDYIMMTDIKIKYLENVIKLIQEKIVAKSYSSITPLFNKSPEIKEAVKELFSSICQISGNIKKLQESGHQVNKDKLIAFKIKLPKLIKELKDVLDEHMFDDVKLELRDDFDKIRLEYEIGDKGALRSSFDIDSYAKYFYEMKDNLLFQFRECLESKSDDDIIMTEIKIKYLEDVIELIQEKIKFKNKWYNNDSKIKNAIKELFSSINQIVDKIKTVKDYGHQIDTGELKILKVRLPALTRDLTPKVIEYFNNNAELKDKGELSRSLVSNNDSKTKNAAKELFSSIAQVSKNTENLQDCIDQFDKEKLGDFNIKLSELTKDLEVMLSKYMDNNGKLEAEGTFDEKKLEDKMKEKVLNNNYS